MSSKDTTTTGLPPDDIPPKPPARISLKRARKAVVKVSKVTKRKHSTNAPHKTTKGRASETSSFFARKLQRVTVRVDAIPRPNYDLPDGRVLRSRTALQKCQKKASKAW